MAAKPRRQTRFKFCDSRTDLAKQRLLLGGYPLNLVHSLERGPNMQEQEVFNPPPNLDLTRQVLDDDRVDLSLGVAAVRISKVMDRTRTNRMHNVQ